MGPKALIFIQSLARKSLTKGQGSGITKIPSAMQAEAKASEIFTNLVEAGLKPEMMDDFIRSEADVAKYLNILDAYKRERMKPIPADSPRGREITEALFGKRGTVVDMKGNVIPEGSGIMGGESIESLMKSGDVTKGTVTKKSKKVTDRDMFKAANERLGKPKTDVNTIIKNINSMEPIDAMKEANKVIKREGPYKNLNQQQAKKILEDTEDHIFERDVTPMDEDFAAGGVAGLLGERTGYAQGTDVFRRQKKEIPEEIKKKIFEMIMGTRNLGKVIENSERTKSRIGSEGVKAYGLAEGGRTGYKEGLTAKQFKRQETENLAAKINEYFDIKGSGSISGKNQIMDAPDGITANTETFNAIINMDIPIIEKINLLGSFGFGKDRFKVEKGDEELFLGEGGYKDRNIGLGFNQGGEGLSGSVIRNLETGDNDYQVKFLKKFASGGRVGLRYGGDTMGGINDKSVSSPGPDRSKVSAQQERNNQAAVREAQAFNQKKEETINRIKEAQPKQSPIKTFFNPRLQKHFDQNQMLKDAVARGEITPEQYNELGGYDVQQTLSLGNPLLGGIGNLIGSTGYNIVQSSIPSKDSSGNVIYEDTPFIIGEDANTIYSQTPKASQLFRDIPGDVYRNVKGGLGLISPELKQTYKNILAQGAGQYQTGGRVGLKGGGMDMGAGSSKSSKSSGPAGGASSGGNYGGNNSKSDRDDNAGKLPYDMAEILRGTAEQVKDREQYGAQGQYQRPPSTPSDGGDNKINLINTLNKFRPDTFVNPYNFSVDLNKNIGPFGLNSFINTLGILGIDDPRTPEDESEQDDYGISASYIRDLLGGDLVLGAGYSPKTGTNLGLSFSKQFNQGGRVGLAGGMTRRAFLKLMGGVAAGIGAIKSGIIGAGKKGVAKKVVKEVIKTPPVAGKPEWFDALINKVILEGDDVTKKLATKDREIVHTKKLNDQESVTVTQDLDDGAIRVEYDSPDNLGQEPVMMQFKPGMADETTGGKKPADRFDVVETEPRYTGPDNTDIEFIGESGGPNISFIESDVTNLKTFATGKGPTMKEIVKSKKRKDLTRAVNENDYEAAEYLGGKYGDVPEPDFPDDYSGYASGGIAGMLGE
jgi:hypothetical protein